MKQPKFFIFLLSGVLGALSFAHTAIAEEIVTSRTENGTMTAFDTRTGNITISRGATRVIIDPDLLIPEPVLDRVAPTTGIIDRDKVIPEPVLDREAASNGISDPEGVADDSVRVLPPEPIGVADDSVRVLPPERTDEESWFSHWNSSKNGTTGTTGDGGTQNIEN